jgi:CheY-like chemotaxis protein
MSQTAPTKRPSILIVEDDFEIAWMLAATLAKAGMHAEIAGDGVDMDVCLRRSAFDLIVLDVMLPGEDGFSLCRRLRASTTVPIIMLTAQRQGGRPCRRARDWSVRLRQPDERLDPTAGGNVRHGRSRAGRRRK